MWKRLGGLLDMNLTLQENGVKDEDEMFDKLGMNSDQWLPVIHLYFRYLYSGLLMETLRVDLTKTIHSYLVTISQLLKQNLYQINICDNLTFLF